MAADTSARLTVTGSVKPGWEEGRLVIVDDEGTGRLLTDDVPTGVGLLGRRVTITGVVATPVPGAEGVPALSVDPASLAEAPPGRRVTALAGLPDEVGGEVTIRNVPAGADLRVDGLSVTAADGNGVARWDTSRVRDGVHLVSLLPQDADMPLRAAWTTVSNGGGPPDPLPGREVFRADFETGDLSQWDVVQAVRRSSVQAVRTPVREGRYAARVEVRQGDDPIDSVGNRSELSLNSDEAEGVERWYSWSTMVAPDFPAIDNWQVLTQWHAEAQGPPPVGLYMQADRMFLQVNRHAAPDEPLSTEFPWTGPLLPGRWRDIVLRIRWSGDDAVGLIQMWVDGVEVVPATNIRTLYPGVGAYLKQGY